MRPWRNRRLHQTICSRDVLAHYSAASRLRHRLDHFAQLLEVIPRMVGMRVVARPEKLALAHERHQPRDRPFVRVSRNEALTLEIVRRFLAQLHRLTDSRAADDRVAAIEEVADPSGARLEHYHLEFREALEDSGLEECRERMLYAVPRKQVEVPCRPAELIVTMVDTPRRRFERRMDRERYVVILRYREDSVVRRVAVRPARKRERRDERAFAQATRRPGA